MRVDYRLDDRPVCPALWKRDGERPPAWSCQCRRPDGRPMLRKHRHTEPWQCIPEGVAQAFRILHPEIKTLANARRMLWMERTFDPREEGER